MRNPESGDVTERKFGGKTKLGDLLRLPHLFFLVLTTARSRCSLFDSETSVSCRNCEKSCVTGDLGQKGGVYWGRISPFSPFARWALSAVPSEWNFVLVSWRFLASIQSL